MKKSKLTKKQLEELEKFGTNTWFLEYLQSQQEQMPDEVLEKWKKFLDDDERLKLQETSSQKSNGSDNKLSEYSTSQILSSEVKSDTSDEERRLIAGSAQRILDNMTASLSIPVATSQRTIPVKLLEENRTIINQHLQKRGEGKISFTHIISWAILKAIQAFPVMNNAFQMIDGKPHLIIRKDINLGIAVDIQRKDGSRSLLVPNIKKANQLNFLEFWKKYDDLIERSRKGIIDPSEFQGTTVSITNPGTIGTVASIPRLMVGQGVIVAVGAIQYNAEYQAMSSSVISSLGISKVMNITSTYDHRIIQGAESGMFLREISDLLLGKKNFYEEIFEALNIPIQPLKWETDFQPSLFAQASANTDAIERQAKVLQLINFYRVRGHLIADIDPLGSKTVYHPELDPSTFNFTVWDLDREFITGGFAGMKTATLRDIINILQKTYCDKIGVEFMHIQNPAEKIWLQEKMESNRNTPNYDTNIKKEILKNLTYAETFEHFVHTRFVGHKRFSLEGNEALIPVLNYLLTKSAESNIIEAVIGMAHRGRLNVLVNVMGKSVESIFSEFEDIYDLDSIQGSGDVKYHLGAAGKHTIPDGRSIQITLSSNPSHLEWVNPVVEGIARAKQTRLGDSKTHQKVIPILIHGDAAFAGQGVVAETLNLSQLSGYRTGGTIHIIVNNQIGFTTTPESARSSTYATDVAKMIQAPIFHVNGDDPEAALWVTEIALEYRNIFKKDVVIDLLGYRRHGHNEGDEPGFTQPLMYEKIKQKKSVYTLYTERLIKEGVITKEEADKIRLSYENKLAKALDSIKRKSSNFAGDLPLAVPLKLVKSQKKIGDTFISESMLQKIIKGITTIPEDFNGHPKLQKFLEKRKQFLDNTEKADWALAESIAFGSLLLEGTPIRLSGQDSVRGTFSQRHLALTDVKNGNEYIPLNHLDENQAMIEALDSSLSEAAVLGFEFGYSVADPLALVIWEAQFGDFANGAQVMIDNFIVASYEKWNVPNSLVMLLPHGYEGQGPEHSSARIERFLILSAEDNMYVTNPSTPAQYFHLLRRHIKHHINKPLVIFTPKSLLRLPEARSSKEEFLSGKFLEVIDDNSISNKSEIKKVILCSGKVFYELVKYREQNKINDTAIVRLEQYYPFNEQLLKNVLHSYSNSKKLVWVQEEPRNMGAWNFLWHRLNELLLPGQKLFCSSRPESASPAVGSQKLSNQQQKYLIINAFDM
ncbi:MAG: multifunctional oxoglutarate decarboxylase/oxoglutarate dehydrogenase thiamine pyrophosphate-binding subunit/dihydrolipoyllysine-residue succinyltransferase subunit [Ignavibacterium sp.]|nr:multifunctional oxoglutarate decarboxylase/oxoglutarate dehydrogenase thiamine pyrophosphate-binding subunit/dihydrolipoyllysine-residue succinyltransferase subunit [Ignavibacterium sp.]MDW8375878.1 multifunctional oxoglutarate decarboxylase/oxoglutarate dehydrogenase thiamine pyrophosphate-binding subunit/dihydrolipoyllysine-residue succinyltransferase subunit [Ignavibacteriales bacterium]